MSLGKKSCEFGPVCWCNPKKLRQLRAMLRRQLDADHSEPQDEPWGNYTNLVREVIKDAVALAQSSLKIQGQLVKPPDNCTFALSLVSGASQLWRNSQQEPLSGQRISYVLPEVEGKSIDELDDLQLSPVQVLYRIDREQRPLWILIKKPLLEQDVNPPGDKFWSELGSGEKPSVTFSCLVKTIQWPDDAVENEALKVAMLLDEHPIYRQFLNPVQSNSLELLRALRDAWRGFKFAKGQYLWIFGFDADREPSPYRTVVGATNDPNAETCGELRRWLNIFATILGEVAAVERSVSSFIASAKAKAFVVKSDPIRWESLKRNQDTLDTLKKRLFPSDREQALAAEDAQATRDLLGLLPRTRSVPAHRHTVLSMPEYRGAPSLRDMLLKTRALDTQSEVTRVFKGILEKLKETLYAVAVNKPPFDSKEQSAYIQGTYLQKYRERRSAVLARCAEAIKNPGGLKTAEHLPIYLALESIYSEGKHIEISCPSRTNFKGSAGDPITLNGSASKKWKSRKTEPVWSILGKLSSMDDQQLERLIPPMHCLTHGDLHFGNILLDLGDLDDPVFKLIDAQIDLKGRDIVADLSKLLQSCDALGDFVFEGLFQIKVWQDTSESCWAVALNLGGGSVSWPISGGASGAEIIGYLEVDELQFNCFKWIREAFKDTVESIIGENLRGKDWLQRAVFAEAMNLLTSPSFFLPENPEKALAFAASGAMVLTEWHDEFDGKSLIN